jgi:16S rRNA (cytosine967-C5)-methyltransferase
MHHVSGLGVQKNPDAKWKLKPEFIDNMRKIQGSLRKLFENCKTRREMVYATCSILPSENQDQIAHFDY